MQLATSDRRARGHRRHHMAFFAPRGPAGETLAPRRSVQGDFARFQKQHTAQIPPQLAETQHTRMLTNSLRHCRKCTTWCCWAMVGLLAALGKLARATQPGSGGYLVCAFPVRINTVPVIKSASTRHSRPDFCAILPFVLSHQRQPLSRQLAYMQVLCRIGPFAYCR